MRYWVQICFLDGYDAKIIDQMKQLKSVVTAKDPDEAIARAVREHYGNKAWFARADKAYSGIFGQIFSKSRRNGGNYSETDEVQIQVTRVPPDFP